MVKRVDKFIFGLAIFLFVISVVSAEVSEIKVKTAPRLEVQLVTFDSESVEFVEFEKFTGFSDQYGNITFNFDADSEVSNFNIVVYIYDYDKKVASKKFSENYEPGESISLKLFPTGYEIIDTPSEDEVIANETLENNVTTNESTISAELLSEGNKEPGITGLVVDKVFNKTIAYVIIGVFLLAAVVFFVVRTRKRLLGKKGIIVRKLSELTQNNEEKKDDYQGSIEEAEKKIKEAQGEINSLRNQSRIREAERKLQQDQADLRRLRDRGY